ncbi:interferon-induced protein 44-like [Alosa pseudoharengus]|uniref:interferon-induced protein 44-like n=1 Tax=Alosa pseudoharengus TaxID=34774 RepID=UPI003F8AF1A4
MERADMASTTSSIVSKLNLEMERQLLQLFPGPVRLHLLFQASTHGFSLHNLQGKFDNTGQFVIIVYLKRGEARGAYLGRGNWIYGNKFQKWFLFNLTSKQATSIPSESEAEADQGPWEYGNAMILREEHMNRTFFDVPFCVDFSSDEMYNTGWAEESVNNRDGSLTEVEMFRVQDVGDVLLYPWREMVWKESTREDLRENFVSHKVMSDSLNSARVLLLGPAGTGKSSFINSIRSVMLKRITHMSVSGAGAPDHLKKLKSISIQAEIGGPATSLTLCDVMALGEDEATGLSVSDARAVIKGHVPEGYKFQPGTPFSSQSIGYRAEPGIKDKIHGGLFFLDARKVTTYSDYLQERMRILQAELHYLDVPQIVLLTHVDQVCHAVQEDVKYVYTSRTVKDKMQKAAEFVGIPVSFVLPVRNYASELSTNCNTDILLLSAVHSILQAVDDTLDDQGV